MNTIQNSQISKIVGYSTDCNHNLHNLSSDVFFFVSELCVCFVATEGDGSFSKQIGQEVLQLPNHVTAISINLSKTKLIVAAVSHDQMPVLLSWIIESDILHLLNQTPAEIDFGDNCFDVDDCFNQLYFLSEVDIVVQGSKSFKCFVCNTVIHQVTHVFQLAASLNCVCSSVTDSAKMIVAGDDSLLEYWHIRSLDGSVVEADVNGAGRATIDGLTGSSCYSWCCWVDCGMVFAGTTAGDVLVVSGCVVDTCFSHIHDKFPNDPNSRVISGTFLGQGISLQVLTLSANGVVCSFSATESHNSSVPSSMKHASKIVQTRRVLLVTSIPILEFAWFGDDLIQDSANASQSLSRADHIRRQKERNPDIAKKFPLIYSSKRQTNTNKTPKADTTQKQAFVRVAPSGTHLIAATMDGIVIFSIREIISKSESHSNNALSPASNLDMQENMIVSLPSPNNRSIETELFYPRSTIVEFCRKDGHMIHAAAFSNHFPLVSFCLNEEATLSPNYVNLQGFDLLKNRCVFKYSCNDSSRVTTDITHDVPEDSEADSYGRTISVAFHPTSKVVAVGFTSTELMGHEGVGGVVKTFNIAHKYFGKPTHDSSASFGLSIQHIIAVKGVLTSLNSPPPEYCVNDKAAPTILLFTPSGSHLLVVTGKIVQVFSMYDLDVPSMLPKRVAILYGHMGDILSLVVNDKSNSLLSYSISSCDSSLLAVKFIVWDITTWAKKAERTSRKLISITAMCVNPCGSLVFVGGQVDPTVFSLAESVSRLESKPQRRKSVSLKATAAAVGAIALIKSATKSPKMRRKSMELKPTSVIQVWKLEAIEKEEPFHFYCDEAVTAMIYRYPKMQNDGTSDCLVTAHASGLIQIYSPPTVGSSVEERVLTLNLLRKLKPCSSPIIHLHVSHSGLLLSAVSQNGGCYTIPLNGRLLVHNCKDDANDVEFSVTRRQSVVKNRNRRMSVIEIPSYEATTDGRSTKCFDNEQKMSRIATSMHNLEFCDISAADYDLTLAINEMLENHHFDSERLSREHKSSNELLARRMEMSTKELKESYKDLQLKLTAELKQRDRALTVARNDITKERNEHSIQIDELLRNKSNEIESLETAYEKKLLNEVELTMDAQDKALECQISCKLDKEAASNHLTSVHSEETRRLGLRLSHSEEKSENLLKYISFIKDATNGITDAADRDLSNKMERLDELCGDIKHSATLEKESSIRNVFTMRKKMVSIQNEMKSQSSKQTLLQEENSELISHYKQLESRFAVTCEDLEDQIKKNTELSEKLSSLEDHAQDSDKLKSVLSSQLLMAEKEMISNSQQMDSQSMKNKDLNREYDNLLSAFATREQSTSTQLRELRNLQRDNQKLSSLLLTRDRALRRADGMMSSIMERLGQLAPAKSGYDADLVNSMHNMAETLAAWSNIVDKRAQLDPENELAVGGPHKIFTDQERQISLMRNRLEHIEATTISKEGNSSRLMAHKVAENSILLVRSNELSKINTTMSMKVQNLESEVVRLKRLLGSRVQYTPPSSQSSSRKEGRDFDDLSKSISSTSFSLETSDL